MNLYESDSSVSSSSDKDSDGYFSDVERSPTLVINEAVIFDSESTSQIYPADTAVDESSHIEVNDHEAIKIEAICWSSARRRA